MNKKNPFLSVSYTRDHVVVGVVREYFLAEGCINERVRARVRDRSNRSARKRSLSRALTVVIQRTVAAAELFRPRLVVIFNNN